jgi:hypothetical protein
MLGQGTAAACSKRERIRRQCPSLAKGIKNKFTKNEMFTEMDS